MRTYDRKGQLIGESLALFVTTMLIAIVLIAFFFLIKAQGVPRNIEALDQFSSENAARASLGAYLSTPVKIKYDNENITIPIADLIRLAKTDSSYKENVKSETESVFSNLYGSRYHVSINSQGSNLMSAGRSLALPRKTETAEKFNLITISIPDFEIDLYIFEK